MKKKFTVLTPVYNRASLIHRVYESLISQTYKDFEWLIVDDGSTDNVRQIIEHWASNSRTWFPIRYIYQEHDHKKSAINKGVLSARGELVLILDSDDCAVPEALEVFERYWNCIDEKDRVNYAGVCSLCMDSDGQVVGNRFPGNDYVDMSSLEMKYEYRVSGEKWGFVRRDLLLSFPFREDLSGYVPEHTVWDAIGRRYATRFINQALRIYHTDAPGIISRTGEVIHPSRDALGAAFGKEFVLSNNIDYFHTAPWLFFMEAVKLVRYWFNTPLKYKNSIRFWPKPLLGKMLVLSAVPAGVLLWLHGWLRWFFYRLKIKAKPFFVTTQ